MQLDFGDVVITDTDGVIEATNQSREEWGVHGLLKATDAWARLRTENAEHFVRSIFNSLDDFSRGCQTDDATLATCGAKIDGHPFREFFYGSGDVHILPVRVDIRQALGKTVGETVAILLEERIE